MPPAEIEALVEQVGDEILRRLGLSAAALEAAGPALEAPASGWPRPQAGYASTLELVCGSPETSPADIQQACRRAREAAIPAVWTAASLVATTVTALRGSGARVGALIDFPQGASSTPARLADIETALLLGAEMVNLVLGAGRAKSADADVLRTEVRAAASLCSDAGAALAVTLDAELLSEQELARVAAAALAGGADALCSSTGGHTHAFASDRAVKLLREVAGDRAVVIAGGRVPTFGHAAALIAAGADRIATGDPWAILAAARAR